MIGRRRTLIRLLAALTVVAAACGGAATTTTTPTTGGASSTARAATTAAAPESNPSASPPTTAQTPTTTMLVTVPEDADVPPQLENRELAVITVDGEPLLVAIADTTASRRRGLMEVADLLDLDGMLFVWTEDTSGGFWMRNTIIPLDIAFFTADGALVNTFSMEPCDLGNQCPTYPSGGTYRFALETAEGRLASLTPDATLVVPETVTGNAG